MHCCSPGKSDRFGILEFGPQTRNFHPGGCLSPHSLTLTLKRQNKAVEEDEGPERSNREQKRPEEKRSVEEEPETHSKSGIQGHNQKKDLEKIKVSYSAV
ncbi:hypothetical protein PHYPO_G00223280 [Pangasianodon hypophthalmus]|uniref:Uncharacterized protein n=2 Tax=Pangasianodon TaxID=30992 RepID=A0A5N5NVS4_PANHP|nr:hypothetical protein PHYPO_G00223280 [Pangasianodon hypophthalmus]MCI4380005.1 hypothetical protein [Pangasianodon gigas]